MSKTIAFYDAHAEEIGAGYEATESPMRKRFARAFPAGSRVADVGAGTGRDAAALMQEGYAVVAIEPSLGMRRIAREYHPGLDVREGSLPELPTEGAPYDGILCCAVLQHLQHADLERSATAFHEALVPGGRLLIAIPVFDDAVPTDRFFSGIEPDALATLFCATGFEELERWAIRDERQPPRTWYEMLFERPDGETG